MSHKLVFINRKLVLLIKILVFSPKKNISLSFGWSKAGETSQIGLLKGPLVTPVMSSLYPYIKMFLIDSVVCGLDMNFVKMCISTTESRFWQLPSYVAMNVARTTPGLVEMAPPS